MAETFTALLLAHLMADFLLQPDWMAGGKRRALPLVLHGTVVLIAAQATLGQAASWPLLALALVHVAIDAAKARLPSTLGSFVADQAAHLVSLGVVAALAPGLWADGFWAEATWLPAIYAHAAGALAAILTGGHVVGFLVGRWEAVDLPLGLPGAGRLIGQLERGLIVLFVLGGEPVGIGFLIAAKSILRFDAASGDQKLGEYVIIGTLASFGWALAIAEATLALADALPPLGFPAPLP